MTECRCNRVIGLIALINPTIPRPDLQTDTAVSLGFRSRMSAPMLSATRAEDALIEFRARCA